MDAFAITDAAAFDPLQVPLEETPQSAFTEAATGGDVEVLLSVENGDEINGDTLDLLERLETRGWVSQDASGTVELTPIGHELLRHRSA